MRQIRITTVADMLDLSPEEFHRMLPDLALWYSFAKQVHGMRGVQNTGFVWADDGQPGITVARVTNAATGEVTEVRP